MVILCPNSVFLDELLFVFKQVCPLSAGRIELDGDVIDKKYVMRNCNFITNENVIFQNMNVAENIFDDCSLFKAVHSKKNEKYKELLQKIDPSISLSQPARALSAEQHKIVEIIRAAYRRPKLLIARELSNILSAMSFSDFVNVLDELVKDGTTVLYLTNQWEEAIRLNSDVKVVVNGSIVDGFTAQEVRDDPSRIYYSSMCSELPLKDYKKFEEELSVLQHMKQSIRQISNGRNSRKTIETFTKYLMRELHAASVITFLINTRQQMCIDTVPVSDIKESSILNIVHLNSKTLITVLNHKKNMTFNNDDPDFLKYYEDIPDFASSVCYSIEVNSDVSLVVQTNFQNKIDNMDYALLMIEWVVQEMSLFIENQQLMGNSLLLKESHHRIKNNLQVIVSLLEMEKMVIAGRPVAKNMLQETEAAFDSAVNRIKCISSIHDALAKKDENTNILDISRIIVNISDFYQCRAKINISFDTILIPYAKAVSIALVINELISNSIKHNDTKENLQIYISAKKASNRKHVVIICRDNGSGFLSEGAVGYDTNGVGMMVIDSVILDEMNGTVQKYNQDGAVVKIEIPVQSFLPADIQ